MKKEIQSREDVALLVQQFYAKIREDSEIGFYFNETIAS